MTRAAPDDPAKPGLDLCNAYLRPLTQEEMDRDRIGYVQAIQDRHGGATIVVLGTGPSMTSVDSTLLDRFVTIGCNGIGRLYQPDYYVICDPFIYALHQDVFRACTGTRILSSFTRGECDLRIYYRREDLIGLSRDQVFSADSTGYVALSSAFIMGASRIVLAGYDGYPAGRGAYHCYDEPDVETARVQYEWRRDEEKQLLMRRAYEFAARAAADQGCDIRLLTPSHLVGDLFRRVNADELATWA
jgi:hypothetical protein